MTSIGYGVSGKSYLRTSYEKLLISYDQLDCLRKSSSNDKCYEVSSKFILWTGYEIFPNTCTSSLDDKHRYGESGKSSLRTSYDQVTVKSRMSND